MSADMQTKSEPSVAFDQALKILRSTQKRLDDDIRLVTLLGVCAQEQRQRDKLMAEKAGTDCFGTSVTDAARWAAVTCGIVDAGLYPQTRKFLAMKIVDGFVGTRNTESEARFAEVICTWPAADGELMADALQDTLEFRKAPKEKLARLFAKADPRTINIDVLREAVKAIGKYAEPEELVLAGKLFFLLVDTNKGRAKLVQNDVEQHLQIHLKKA